MSAVQVSVSYDYSALYDLCCVLLHLKTRQNKRNLSIHSSEIYFQAFLLHGLDQTGITSVSPWLSYKIIIFTKYWSSLTLDQIRSIRCKNPCFNQILPYCALFATQGQLLGSYCFRYVCLRFYSIFFVCIFLTLAVDKVHCSYFDTPFPIGHPPSSKMGVHHLVTWTLCFVVAVEEQCFCLKSKKKQQIL